MFQCTHILLVSKLKNINYCYIKDVISFHQHETDSEVNLLESFEKENDDRN